MKKVSMTQQANVVALFMIVSRLFDLDLDKGQMTEIVTGIVALLAVLTSFYGRYRVGDLKWFGKRK